ncbi:hypothetical protein Taro_005723 [Colocasia esculenta]|uniref:Uncharacterized protein n=1 Tax=Colocasia esculenta TaxID=4460 RepID=A0A843TV45_COLES|nr:hypothetical protein [Colocasia esculenta]
MESEGFHLRRPRVRLPVHDRDCLPIHAGRPGDRDCLPVHAGHPGDRDRLHDHASSASFPFFLTTRWRASIQQRMRRGLSYLDGIHVGFQGPVDAWREFSVPRRYAFTRPEDLGRARAVWESTAQTNLRKSMYEARDKAMKTTGNRDPMAWLDYGHHHELERAPTFRELFDRTHKRKGTDDYETYGRTMADRYAEGTPQPDLDPEAWVDVAGGPRKGRVYGFGDSLDTTPVLSSYASSVAPPTYASSSTALPGNGVEEMRTLIREELWTHFGVMLEQLISAMQGVRPSQPAPQVSITINFI